MIETVRNTFVRLHQVLHTNEEPNDRTRRELLDLINEVESFTLHAREDVEYPLLLDWIVGGYVRIMDLFFSSWNNKLLYGRSPMRQEFENVFEDIVARCDATKIDDQSLLNLAYDLTNLQGMFNSAYSELKKSSHH